MNKLQHKANFHSQKVFDHALKNSQYWTTKSTFYSSEQIFRTLISAGLNKSSVEDQCLFLQGEAGGYGSSPSADVVMKSLDKTYGNLDMREIEDIISQNLQKEAVLIPQFKHRKSKVIVAVDLHDEEYYGQELTDDNGRIITMYGQMKNRSGNVAGHKRRVFRYATACIVSFGKRLQTPITIGFAINFKGQTRDDVLRRILEQIALLNLKISYVVIDGGFASIDCFALLKDQGLQFYSRGKYWKTMKHPMEQNYKHTLKQLKKSIEVNAFVLQAKSAKGKYFNILYYSSEMITLKRIRRIYGKRFRIENTYRHARVVKIRTSTRKLHLRWVFWGITMLLELLWELIRIIYNILGLGKYSARQKSVNRYFITFLIHGLKQAKMRFA